ncbi:MAG: MtnX-like HAD-IB family phosphatase [Candidatus Erginobacter occultus]|nr:MtnX-like HAD-IB family phosphatase [Candidatus Erginobacter occultus]
MTLKIDISGKKAAMVFDFDGTVTEEDIFDAVFARFADPQCWEAHRAYHDREISMKEAYLAMAEYFRGSEEDVLKFVASFARLRPGFRRLLARLKAHGVRVMIVSNGFDLYLRFLLDRWKIRLAEEDILCHRARIADNCFIPSFNEHRDLRDRNCLIGKAEIVRELQAGGYFVIFAGNGTSDTPAGKAADLVFARERLAVYCREENLPCVPFSDFFEVERYLFTNSGDTPD